MSNTPSQQHPPLSRIEANVLPLLAARRDAGPFSNAAPFTLLHPV
jgi:hypothetical protein